MRGFRTSFIFCTVFFWFESPASPQPQVLCFFIFGDSLVDNGNNNNIITLSRANYRPYGIDFPLGATGCFTNGQTFVDALAHLLGFPYYIPPYTRNRGPILFRGQIMPQEQQASETKLGIILELICP